MANAILNFHFDYMNPSLSIMINKMLEVVEEAEKTAVMADWRQARAR